MEVDLDYVHRLVDNPIESLNVELKSWINPAEPEGETKLVATAISLRNKNGGYLVIGLDDKTRQPLGDAPPDVRALFHDDVVQGLVSRFASESFEVAVSFVSRAGVDYPVIAVPTGVRSPVALKRKLAGWAAGTVLFRTLSANGVVSTAAAQPADWREIMEICLDNREADIARFVRRHLSDIDLSKLGFLVQAKPQPSELLTQEVEALCIRSRDFFLDRCSTSSLSQQYAPLGAFEVAMQTAPHWRIMWPITTCATG